MFLVPWWLFLWMSGRRYSLRRVFGNTLVAALIVEVAGTAWFWAARSLPQPYLHALPFAALAAALAAAYSSLEPFFALAGASLREGRFRGGILKATGWGFVTWWAFLAALACRWQAPHLPFLAAWLAALRSAAPATADAKFVVAATVVALPLVILVRQTAIACDGAALRARPPEPAPRGAAPGAFGAAGRRTSVPPPGPRPAYVPPGPRPQYVPPPPRPARIVSVEIGSPKDRDGA
jgi:hypothetical protein